MWRVLLRPACWVIGHRLVFNRTVDRDPPAEIRWLHWTCLRCGRQGGRITVVGADGDQDLRLRSWLEQAEAKGVVKNFTTRHVNRDD